jgi:transcriptional regulator
MRILDASGLRASVSALMEKYEAAQKKPVQMDLLSENTMRQMNGIIGFEVEIKSIEAAYKLSQSRDDKNHTAVIDSLRETANPSEKAIADAMENQRTSQHE